MANRVINSKERLKSFRLKWNTLHSHVNPQEEMKSTENDIYVGQYNRLFIFNKNVSFFSISLNDIRAYKAKFVELYCWVYYICRYGIYNKIGMWEEGNIYKHIETELLYFYEVKPVLTWSRLW